MWKTTGLSRKLVAWGLCSAILAACVQLAPTAPDTLVDPTFAAFGTGGKVITPFVSPPSSQIRGMALQPDGKIVVVGYIGEDLLVMRYLSNGVLDTSFGTGGKAILSYGQYSLGGTSVAIQSDGNIVVAGSIGNSTSSGLLPDFLLVRLTPTGALDYTFSDDGIVTTNFDDTVIGGNDPLAWSDFALAVLIQPDGKIVACGQASMEGDNDFAVARYQPDGSLDTMFGGDGKVTASFGDDEICLDIALQQDGKLVLVGGQQGAADFPVDHDFEVVRLNSDGTLDSSFDLDGGLRTGFGHLDDIATAVAIQPDGKIVVAGSASRLLGDKAVGTSNDALVARYLSMDGKLDSSFDGDGKRSISSLNGTIRDVAIQPDGKILLLGDHETSKGTIQLAFYRLNPDSSLDTTFDRDGQAFIESGGDDLGTALVLQPDGRIIASGISESHHVLVRLWPDGSLDTGGQQTLGFADPYLGPGTDETAYGMAIQADGKIILAGEVGIQSYTESEIGLARFLPDGQFDTTFGDHGRLSLGFGNHDIARAVAVQPDGKIVVAGSVGPTDPVLSNFMVVRFNPDGTLDNTFGSAGFNVVDFQGGYDFGTAVALTPDGKIVVGGTAFNGVRMVFGVARFNSDGTVDTSFDIDGKQLFEFTVGPVQWASAIAVQTDRKIILAGQVGGDFALVRFNENGSVDTTFGSGGQTVTDMGGTDVINALSLRPDGWFVAAGTRTVAGAGDDFALAQYTPDGVLPSVGPGNPWGKVFVDWGVTDQAFAVDWRGDGQVVVAGCADSRFAFAELPTYSSDPPSPTKIITDFVGSNECALGVKFTESNKIVAAGFQEFNGDKNLALARFDMMADLGLGDHSRAKIPAPGETLE